MNKYKAGDLFTIPLKDSRWAVGQVVCALQDRLSKAFSFGVVSIADEPHVPDVDCEFITFDSDGKPVQLIFAASSNMRRNWKVVGHLPLTQSKQKMQWFHCGGQLYHNDEWIRVLPIEEYSKYPAMSVYGNELVQIRLTGYQPDS
ncbi:immunity 26/phosphotriesterase HocA family protein [Paenibacillus wenxiniae]|uniref:Immunity 26/phosphotriesterase HocA family protein n=1 Tax=Paenibacillus wenxiniae TaxID=1636843 RepID=A0ABW4RHH4_9BACL